MSALPGIQDTINMCPLLPDLSASGNVRGRLRSAIEEYSGRLGTIYQFRDGELKQRLVT